jgi:hypothetical protein
MCQLIPNTLLNPWAMHAGHASHATHACVPSRSLEQNRKAAAIAPLSFQQLTVCDQFATSTELLKPVSDLSV